MSALSKASNFVRRQVALNLDLHHAPHLHFARDTVEENAARIETILEGLTDPDEENLEENGD